jgi:hypothetical protein
MPHGALARTPRRKRTRDRGLSDISSSSPAKIAVRTDHVRGPAEQVCEKGTLTALPSPAAIVQEMERLRFPCYLLSVSLLRPKSFPVNFDNEFRLKPRMAAAFAGDAIVIWSPYFRFSLYFSLLSREFCLETGLHQTASSASQSGFCGVISRCVRTADIPAG